MLGYAYLLPTKARLQQGDAARSFVLTLRAAFCPKVCISYSAKNCASKIKMVVTDHALDVLIL